MNPQRSPLRLRPSSRPTPLLPRLLARFALLAPSFGLLPACGGGGGGGDGGASVLAIESVDVEGRTDVERNRPVVVTFNSPIDPSSVGVAGFSVRSAQGVVPGRVEVDGARVTFFPTVLPEDRNDYVPDNSPAPNGLGFPESARLELVVVGSSPLSVRSRRGRSPLETRTIAFATSNAFLAEEPPVPPRLAGVPVFDPPPIDHLESPDPRDPARSPLVDPSRCAVTVRFTEPMDPRRFNPFLTFTITNETPGYPGAGLPVLGRIAASGDARSFTFAPLFTLGDLPSSSEPFLFRIRIDGVRARDPQDPRALADLSGEGLAGEPSVDGSSGPIAAPIDFYFRTVDKEGEPNFGSFTEEFDDTRFRGGSPDDPTTALWTTSGYLDAPPATRSTVTVDPTDGGFLLPQPLTREGNRAQFLFFAASDFASIGEESLVGWEWGPRSNFVFAAEYRGLRVSVGHTRRDAVTGLGFDFAGTFSGFPDNPTRVFSGDYAVPNSLSATYFPWPEFETDFEYDGVSNVSIDVDVPPGAATFQLFRCASPGPLPVRRTYGPSGSATAIAGENTVYHSRFAFVRKKSYAVSRLIDTGIGDPDFVAPLVVADASRAGSSYGLTFRGEDEGAGGIPNGVPVGPFDDMDRLDGVRHVLFRFELRADPFTGVLPRIDSISLAWRRD